MNELHVLGILPARAGSKGIPGKNTRELCGRPLLGWAAEAIRDAPSVARAICSTDNDYIADVAAEYGLEVPFRRPSALSSDKAQVSDVVLHALEMLDNCDKPFTHIVLVQATTPTVTANDVEAAIELVRRGDADTVISGFRVGMHHPAIMFTLKDDGTVDWLFGEGQHIKQRQEFSTVFVRTGLVYIATVEVLRKRGVLYGDRIRALVVDEERAVTIDEERDFRRAQQLMENYIYD